LKKLNIQSEFILSQMSQWLEI